MSYQHNLAQHNNIKAPNMTIRQSANTGKRRSQTNIQRDSKSWTPFRTSIFLELYMVHE